MVNPLFRPHGNAHMRVVGAVLIVDMYGYWNEEMRTQTAKDMLRYVPALNTQGPWGIINLLHDTVIYSEAVYTQTRQGYAYRSKNSRLQAVAFVIAPHVEGATLLRPRFDTLLQGVVTSGVFADLASAQTWMQAQLESA